MNRWVNKSQTRGEEKGRTKWTSRTFLTLKDCSRLVPVCSSSPVKYFPNSLTYIAHMGHRCPSASYEDTATQRDFKDWRKCKQVVGYRVGARPSNTQSPSFHSVAMCYVLQKRSVRKRVSPEQFFGRKTFPLINVERKHLFVVTHVCSLMITRSFCCRNLHANETLGFYFQSIANWYDLGHPVLSPWTPKISSFNPHMAFYSTTVLRFWCIYKSLRYLLKKSLREALEGTGEYT